MQPTFNLLVIDDEEGIRESLADYLEDMGFTMFTAESGEKGLEILAHHPVDLAIVDLRLPGIDGTQTIVKAHAIYPDLKFLVHTGSVTYNIPEDLIAMGFTARQIMHKPMPNLNSMVEMIRDVLAS